MSTWVAPETVADNASATAAHERSQRDNLNWLKGALAQINVDDDAAPSNLGRGTSFPGSPAQYDIFFRTDRQIWYFYDGAAWLSVDTHTLQFPPSDGLLPWTSTAVHRAGNPWAGLYTVKILDFIVLAQVQITNDGSNYWTGNLQSFGGTVVSGPVNTAGMTAGVELAQRVAVGTNVTHAAMQALFTQEGAPGALYLLPSATYKLVG